MRKSIWLYVYKGLRRFFQRYRIYPVIYNANCMDENKFTKRALLIYLVESFLPGAAQQTVPIHQNRKQCRQIAKVLGELGYIVDVVDIGDKKFRPSRNYDLLVSHRSNLNKSFWGNKTIKIFLATVANPVVHNRSLKRRHQLLHGRRGKQIRLRRVYSESLPYPALADAIVGFGNEYIMNTWKESFPVPAYPFNNYGFQGTKFVHDSKDFATARKNFLFFASGSQTQKGLDLLLEIFPKHPELQLYICSRFRGERDFCDHYHKELYETPNIHAVGWIRVNSKRFYELVQTCAYVIHPTCSDGQPGSVVQCMYAGLIPVLTKQAGIDTENFGITFTDDSLEEIERVVLEVSQRPESWHQRQSIQTRRTAEHKYSEDAFLQRWAEILKDILNTRSEGHIMCGGVSKCL